MKQKMAYMSIGVIFTVILSFTWLSYASQSSEMEGRLTVLDPERQTLTLFDGQDMSEFTLDDDAIVYKNNERVALTELSLDDEVKVLLNSNKEVRYVVAASEKESADSIPAKAEVKSVTDDRRDRNEEARKQTRPSIKKEEAPPAYSEIREFELKIHLTPGHKIELEYENKEGKTKWEQKNFDIKQTVDSFMRELALTPDMNKEEMVERVFQTLGVDRNFKKFELEVDFANGKEIEIELNHNGKEKSKYKEKYKD